MPRPVTGRPLVEYGDATPLDDLLDGPEHEDEEPGPDPVEVLSLAMDQALYEHRGTVMSDLRYHCVCGWVSEQVNAHTLGRKDVRRHLVTQQWLRMAGAMKEARKVSRDG